MERKHSHKRENRKLRIRRMTVAIIVVFLSFCLPWLAARFNWLQIDDDAAINVFCVCATAIGTLLVIIELNSSERVSCCSMLSEMNMKFIENERLTKLYQELCRCVQEPGRELVVNDNDPDAVHSADLMAYMTFYEVINEYIKNGVLTIQQMDDLFGDRFFKLIHNAYVQEHELYAEPSSYVNIFELYEAWRDYREKSSSKNKHRFVVSAENEIPKLYVKQKLYLQETVQFYSKVEQFDFQNKHGQTAKLTLRRLLPRHFSQVDELQTKVVEGIDDPGIFAISTDEEIYESMLVDYCYGLFDGDKLVAVCICVLNRKTKQNRKQHERNLCIHTNSKKEYHDYVTFDTIQVAKEYRGFGIQRFFLAKAESVAKKARANHIIATVAPNNQYSRAMFEEAGYEKFGGREIDMYNSKRYLMVKEIKRED